MPDYGLTANGVNIKRLDEIAEEMHTQLSEEWGINTQQNPTSLVNVLIMNVADSLAELWELGQDVYNSQYPSTADGMYLDNVGQFAGISRETALPSYYHILCTGVDGTTIPNTTMISSATSPVTYLYPTKDYTIERGAMNTAVVKIVSQDGEALTIALNDRIYSFTPTSGMSDKEALEGLYGNIQSDDFEAWIGDDDDYLHIAANEVTSMNTLILSDNLTTEEVGCVFTFQTEENGDIYMPAGAITGIERAVTGLTSVVNVGTYIAGRLVQTDVEYRQSYMDKIFTRSSRMSDSIRSAILNECQGVLSVAVYENDQDYTDEYGRYPHSIECMVDGGDDTEIAEQILNTKAGGINTFGEEEVVLTGTRGEDITIRFNRPTYVNVWIRCTVGIAKNSSLPTDYADLIRSSIVNSFSTIECGDNVIPQEILLPNIYANVYGVGYIEIKMETGDTAPEEYSLYNLYVSMRERAITSEEQIEVVIHV